MLTCAAIFGWIFDIYMAYPIWRWYKAKTLNVTLVKDEKEAEMAVAGN